MNRRELFAAGAAVAAVAAPVAVQAASPADAELIALEREYDAARQTYARTSAEATRLYRAYEQQRPTASGALIAKESDVRLFPGTRMKAGEGIDGTDVWAIRDRMAMMSAPVLARAQEIIEAHERLMEEDAAVSTRTGFAASGEIDDAAYDALCAVEKRIVDAPCTSMGWARLKARVARDNRPEADTMDWSELAAFSVVDFVLAQAAH